MDKIKQTKQKKISIALSKKCMDLMKLIKTPSLTQNDVNYFKYKKLQCYKRSSKIFIQISWGK